MDYFTKNKVLFWCILVLFALNVVTLTFFWLTRPPHPPQGRQSGPDGKEVMEERLQLSDEQVQQLQEIRESHFSRKESLQEDMHQLRLDLLDELFSPEPDNEKMKQKLSELEQQLGQFEGEMLQHFSEMIAICDQQQAEELKFMLIELIERGRPRPSKQHRRGPDGDSGSGHRLSPRH